MLIKITLIFALAIAVTSAVPASIGRSFAQSNPTALAGGNGIRDNRYTSTAQYCVPEVDDGADPFRVYC